MNRGGIGGGMREVLVVVGLLVFGILLTLPYSGGNVHSSPDGLFYEAQKREVQGDSAQVARREVFSSSLATPLKEGESNLAPSQQRVGNPDWVDYSARFYRRRWTVPVLAAALNPVFGHRSLEEVSQIGWALLAPLLYLLLRRRFSVFLSAAASVFCSILPPLIDFGPGPGTDTWGLALLIAGLLIALLIDDRGLRWLPAWIALVLVMSFTRDLAVVLVLAAGWLALSARSRDMGIATLSAIIASIPAPLIFSVPLRDNLAYVLNDFRVPTDTSWSWIASHYPSQLGDLIHLDATYPTSSPIPTLITIAMGLAVLAGLVLFVLAREPGSSYMSLIRGATLGGILTILISVNYTGMRLELVFVPAVATGLALLGEELLSRFSTSQHGRGPAAAVSGGPASPS